MFQKLCISEADRLCKAYTDAWTFALNNWYPSSFRLDWSGLPKDWPCSHLTDDEWSTLLNASANRMRNTGFILAVIRCLPESIQNTWRALLNFCVTTGMTAKSIKTYIRIAIPKNPSATAFRHLAIGYDFHCKQMEVYHARIMLFFDSRKDGLLPPQITSFMRSRSAADSNLVRKSVREDVEQARISDPTASLGISCTDQQKCYDSITDDIKQLVLLAFNAPIMFLRVLAETSKDNSFVVRTTEGDTDVTKHENGERQGNVLACTTVNFVNTLVVLTLTNRGLMYRMSYVESEIAPDELGCFYVDDQEWQANGKSELLEIVRILSIFSIVSRIGLNGPEKSFFSLYTSVEGMIDEIKMVAWDRESETVIEKSMSRLKDEECQKSLGIILGEKANVHRFQDPIVQRKIHAALSRVAGKKLSRIEMQTLMT